MPSRAKVIGLGASLPTVLVLAHGCKGPTQVTVDVKTNVVCADQRGIDIVAASDPHKAEERAALVTPGTARFPSATTNDCKEGPAPRTVGTLVLTPSGGAGAMVVISAFGNATLADCTATRFAAQCIVARRRFAFVEEKQLVLPVLLDPECAGVPCNESSTCVGKKCVDAQVDCSGGTCTEPGVLADGGVAPAVDASALIDAEPPIDGAPNDSGDGAIADGASDSGDASDGSSTVDGGGGTCGTMSACMQNGVALGVACAGGAAYCCYGSNTTTCGGVGMCPSTSLAACCRDANDCALDEVCCATTQSLQAGTQIFCKKKTDCAADNGRPVCATNFPECRGTGPCSNNAFSTEPQYFNCS